VFSSSTLVEGLFTLIVILTSVALVIASFNSAVINKITALTIALANEHYPNCYSIKAPYKQGLDAHKIRTFVLVLC